MTSSTAATDPIPCATALDFAAFRCPHPNPFVCELTIQPAHLGETIGHVSNVEYVRWLDRLAELHSGSLGYSRDRLLELEMMWFVARHEIDYHAEAWLDDELILATWVRDIGRIKSWREYLIVRPGDERVICRASSLWVLVDLNTRRPRRVPEEMAARFDPCQGNESTPPCTSR